MMDFDDPEPEEKEEVNEPLELAKACLRFLFSKRVLQGYALVGIAFFSWKYTEFFKLPDKCYDARPNLNTTLSIENPNMRWEEFQGLEMKGMVKTLAEDGKKEIIRSYDILTGKPAEVSKKYLLNGFINSYDAKLKGCVESVTVFARIKTLSGKKAVLNESFRTVKLQEKFLSTEKEKENPRKIKSRKCMVKLTINPIDPMRQTAQVPEGNITMSCS